MPSRVRVGWRPSPRRSCGWKRTCASPRPAPPGAVRIALRPLALRPRERVGRRSGRGTPRWYSALPTCAPSTWTRSLAERSPSTCSSAPAPTRPGASSRSKPPAARFKNGSSGTSSGGSARRLSPGLVDRVAAGDLRHGDAGALGHSALGGRRDHPVAIATRYQVGLAFQAELGRGRPPRRPGHRPRPGGAWSGTADSRP